MRQIIGVGGMVLCFLMGSYFVFTDKTLQGILCSLAAFGFLLAAVIDWSAILAGMTGKLKKPSPDSRAPKGARPARAERAKAVTGGKSAPVLPAAPALWERLQALKVPEELVVSWSAFLGLAAALLVGGQALIFVLSMGLLGWLLTLGSIGMFAHFFFSKDQDFRVPLVSTTPLLVLCLLVGAVLEVVGFYIGWIQHPYPAFVMIIAAAVILTLGLWRYLELPSRRTLPNGEPVGGLRAFESANDIFSRSTLAKVFCVALALFSFAAGRVLSNFDHILAAYTLGTIFLMLSFPWFKSDIRLLDRYNPWTRRMLSWALLALAFIIAAIGQKQVYNAVFFPGLLFFLIAIILVLIAVPAPDAEEDNGKPGSLEFGLFVALLAVGAFLRMYKVSQYPCGVEGDEAGYGWWSNELLHGRYEQIFIHAAQSLYWFWGGVPLQKVFGVVPLALRAHSVYHGVLSLASTYFLLRLFFNWRSAFVTAALMAVAHWHLHFSRFGHYNITQVFAQGVCFYFLLRGARRRNLLDFVLAGIGLSLAVQAHVAGRLIPIFLTVYILYLLLLHRDKFTKLLPGIIIVVVCSWVLLSGPWIQYALRPLWAFGRISEVSIANEKNSNAPGDMIAGVAQSFKSSMLMFNFRGDYRPRDNWLTPEPMLDFLSSIFWVLGFGLCVYWWKRPLFGFTLIAFYGTLLASIMSVESPQSLRTAGNMTMVFMMIAFLVDRVRWSIEEPLGRKGRYLFLGLGFLAIGWAAKANVLPYIERVKAGGMDSLATYIGLEGQKLGPTGHVDFQSEWFGSSHPPVYVFSDGVPVDSYYDIIKMLPTSSSGKAGRIFAFSDKFKPAVEYAKQLYPAGELRHIPDPLHPGENYYDEWFITQDQERAAHGLDAQYQGPAGQKLSQVDGALFGGTQGPAWATRAVWEGSIYSPNHCYAKLYVKGNGSSDVQVDGISVSHGRGAVINTKEMQLPAGLHRVKITWSGTGAPGQLVWDRHFFKHAAETDYVLSMTDQGPQPVELLRSYHGIKPTGLLHYFWSGKEFSGKPPMLKVDPLVQAHWISSGYGSVSWRWKGFLIVDKPGKYSFRVDSAPSGQVKVGGKLLFASGDLAWKPGQPNGIAPKLPEVSLKAGRYPIEASMQSPGGIEYDLQWSYRADDGTAQDWRLIPSAALEPEVNLSVR